ncbi:MAG TPA: hypothetical protein PLR76_00145 [Hyphomonas sp.]|nr:hypothetical protein [Hyphomonas sp.]MCC0017763.1 hypothetical protein [Rhodobiaceae bacterium]HPE46767.1 hypothetical protein [Hyphomonas sp.]
MIGERDPTVDTQDPVRGKRWYLFAQLAFYGLTSVGAYIVLNLLLFAAHPFVKNWPILATTAVTVPPMVISMIHIVVPVAAKVRSDILGRG